MKRKTLAAVTAVALLGLLALVLFRPENPTKSPLRRKGSAATSRGPEKGGTTAHSKVRDFPRHGAIRASSFAVGSGMDPSAPAHPWGRYLAKMKSEAARLRALQVTLNYADTTLTEVLADFAARYGWSIAMDPSIEDPDLKTITFKVTELGADQSMDLIAKMADLALGMDEDGNWWLATKEAIDKHLPSYWDDLERMLGMRRSLKKEAEPDPYLEGNRAVTEQLATLRVDTTARDENLYDVVDRIQEQAQLNIVISSYVRKEGWADVKFTYSGSPAPLGDSMKELLATQGACYYVVNGLMFICTQEEMDAYREAAAAKQKVRDEEEKLFARRVFLGGDDLPIREIASMLSEALSVPVALDPETWERAARFSLHAQEWTVREIIEAIQSAAPVRAALRNGVLWLLTSE